MTQNIGLKISYDPVWERIKATTGWKRNLELADFLEITGSTVSGARKRDSFPIQWAFKVAQTFDCSTDWLLTGEWPKQRGRTESQPEPRREKTPINERLLSDVIEAIEDYLKQERRSLPPKKKAQLTLALYEMFLESEGKIINKAVVIRLTKLAA